MGFFHWIIAENKLRGKEHFLVSTMIFKAEMQSPEENTLGYKLHHGDMTSTYSPGFLLHCTIHTFYKSTNVQVVSL